MTRRKLETSEDYMKVYPRLAANIICASLGYCTPSRAADILRAYHKREKHYCEWIWSCYDCDPKPAVRLAWRGRHTYHGYMADYDVAKALVDRANAGGAEPIFASWF